MKRLTGVVVFLAMALIALLLITHKGDAGVQEDPGLQHRERKISKKGGRAPVKVSNIRAKGKVVAVNKPFVDSDDWLKELTIELANASGKTVTFVMVQLFFPQPDRSLKQPGAAVFMEYGDNPFNYESAAAMPALRVKPLLPGDVLELTLSDAKYDTIKPLLETAKIPHNESVEVRVSAIGFSDGTAWSGQMAQRKVGGGWIPLLDRD